MNIEELQLSKRIHRVLSYRFSSLEALAEEAKACPYGAYNFIWALREISDLSALRILKRLEVFDLISEDEFGQVPTNAWTHYRGFDEKDALIKQRNALMRQVKIIDLRLAELNH